MENQMNKKELTEAIAKEAGVTLADAEKCLNAFTSNIEKTLKRNDKVTLVGFGTFEVTQRQARDGRNPKTGELVKIAASSAPKFKPGKSFKDAINKK